MKMLGSNIRQQPGGFIVRRKYPSRDCQALRAGATAFLERRGMHLRPSPFDRTVQHLNRGTR